MSKFRYMATYKPDVLSCLANLSNDEVFTPPKVAKAMLDMLPQELFENPGTTFLDPVCKTGVFLREIAKRLMKGLATSIPDEQARRDHIFHRQIFGIAITELTSLMARRSLYCSKYPNGYYSVTKFDNPEGNIRYKNMRHRWKNGHCVFCGASEKEFGDVKRKGLESYAYEFIHTTRPEDIFKMKFDVIIGNPPYQLSDNGNGKSAKPLYQNFVMQAKKLNPRYLSMIIPSRWFAGGKGLDSFRKAMINDRRIRKLVDYENFREVFQGVDLVGGACYFLWIRDEKGPCEVTNVNNGTFTTMTRYLNEYDIFIRQNKAVPIVKKVLTANTSKKTLSDIISARKPFGLPTNYIPAQSGVPCWFIQKIGLKYAKVKDVKDTCSCLNKWKLLIPPAPIAGQTDFSKPVGFYSYNNTRIAKPGECCTESWLIAGAFNTKEETISYRSYIFTKMVRFLLLQAVVSQHVTKKNFCFVPDLGHYEGLYTDEMLCKKWGITDDEWLFINSKISDIAAEGETNGQK